MKKHIYLLLIAIVSLTGKSIGQSTLPCNTYDMRSRYIQEHPEIADFEKQLDKDISNFINHHDAPGSIARKTSSAHADTDWYDIPVVVHVIHDNGPELLPDNKIYNLITEMNQFYSLQNNVAPVIAAFKPYIGKAKFRFHLATKDPSGNPTKGITHRMSYLTYGGDDQAKFDQWNPANYVNIWFENVVGQKITNGIIVAYALQPPSAGAAPYRDGIISNYSFIDDGSKSGVGGGSIDHEMGHVMNLDHTFGKTNNPHTNKSGLCTDDDGVDDTPPTEGNLGGCNLYDTVCAGNYFKIYVNSVGGDSLVNYPDTSNEQNIMNYADCKFMFTKGQVTRMRGALNSDVAHRDSLWTDYNLALTGALAPYPDLPPVNDYSVKNAAGTQLTYFTCPNDASGAGASTLKFNSQSWGDTVIGISWTFSNNASKPTATATVSPASASNVVSTVSNTFDTPGWVTMTLASTGNNSGTTTTTYPRSVFVADKTGTPADGYFMDFDNSDTAKWPIFNYYNNEFKWTYANVGMYDHSCIKYTGYDSRGFTPTGSPYGDFDDFFSMPMDLKSFTGGASYLNYFFSSASRTNNSYDIHDRMEIYYSTDRSTTWHLLDTLVKGRLINKGGMSIAYTPSGVTDWSPMSILIPEPAKTNYTVFRFRYKPSLSTGVMGTIDLGAGSVPTSNNFYMDRIHFSKWPAEVSNTHLGNLDVAVVPNPTSGDAYVVIKDVENITAKVVVSDITGKQVYTVSQQISGNQANILIPREVISVKGIYMVQTVTGSQSRTQKLVVY